MATWNAISLVIGARYGGWTIVAGPSRTWEKHGTEIWYRCLCECGTERDVRSKQLRLGRSASCGCRTPAMIGQSHWKHGGSQSRLHTIWSHMKARCYRLADKSFAGYGGRGITVCDEWRDDFAAFQSWALANGYAEDLTLDRRDNDGPYSPENCRFIPLAEQARNRRSSSRITAFGETKTIAEWEVDPRCAVKYHRIIRRLQYGWPPELALTLPPQSAGFRRKHALPSCA